MDRPGKDRELRERLDRVNEEIRGYPQPIARCDAQLAGLLEERDRLRRAPRPGDGHRRLPPQSAKRSRRESA